MTTAGRGRPLHRGAAIAVALTCATVVSACAAQPASTPGDAASTIKQRGAVPIPTQTGPPPPVQASPNHPQIVAVGDPVIVTVPPGSATITALGPQIDSPPGVQLPLEHATATITVHATSISGQLPLRAGDFSVRDDHGRDVPLRVSCDAPSDPTHSATLCLTGDFHTGNAQITWRYLTTPLALWTFTTELD
jgi:hypothetical protein